MAGFHGVEWLNIANLVKALNQEVSVGTRVNVQLVRPGKDPNQAIGYLPDGSMLVVNDGYSQIGSEVRVEVDSVVPSSGGRWCLRPTSQNSCLWQRESQARGWNCAYLSALFGPALTGI